MLLASISALAPAAPFEGPLASWPSQGPDVSSPEMVKWAVKFDIQTRKILESFS